MILQDQPCAGGRARLFLVYLLIASFISVRHLIVCVVSSLGMEGLSNVGGRVRTVRLLPHRTCGFVGPDLVLRHLLDGRAPT